MDRIAAGGTVGLIDTIPTGFTPGSDVANLSVLGYDPKKHHTGRAPLEAASMGVDLAPDDVAFRCNLVTFGSVGSETVMEDFTSGHITSEEASLIIASLNEKLASLVINFHPGVGYRHLMVYKGGPVSLKTTPPHDIVGKADCRLAPKGEGFRGNQQSHGAFRRYIKRSSCKPRACVEGQENRRLNLVMGRGQGTHAGTDDREI